MRATMTLTGLYQYDNTIFDGWRFPEGVDAETLKTNLLYECSGLCITLPNPDLFKIVTNAWCIRKNHAWSRSLAAINAEYDPLHNYDRTEQTSDLESGSSGYSGEASGSTEDKTAAFNSSSYSPKAKSESEQESESSANYGKAYQHTSKTFGNIGVTTSQQMLKSELDIAPDLDIIGIIIRDFKREFTLAVY